MVDKSVGKVCSVMAYGAIAAGVLMNWRNGHPSGAKPNVIGTAVMARRAISGDACMAEDRGGECSIRMAGVTILIRRQMSCCLDQVWIGGEELAGMTTFATTGNVLMQRYEKYRRDKCSSGIVTGTAIILCRDVVHFFWRRDTRVMAR